MAEPLPRGANFNQDATLQGFCRIQQFQRCTAPVEEYGEDTFELFIYILDGCHKFLERRFVDLPDGLKNLINGVEEIIPLFGDERVSLFQGLMLLDSRQVDIAHPLF